MSVYNVSGASLASAYGVGGTSLPSAYDVDGEAVFSPNPLSIKVMTYNCGQWLTGQGTGTSTEDTSAENHRALLQSIITAQDPDILCIQEYWDVIGSVTVASLLGQYFPYIQEVNGETTYFGHAVCSKYPITSTSLFSERKEKSFLTDWIYRKQRISSTMTSTVSLKCRSTSLQGLV